MSIMILTKRKNVIQFIFVLFLFFIADCKKEEIKIIPVIKTDPVTEITSYLAKSGGNISGVPDEAILQRGIVWGIYHEPDYFRNKGMTMNGCGTGSFQSSFGPFVERIIYYVRAYAKTSTDFFYGDEVTFVYISKPTIKTMPPAMITSYSAMVGGKVLANYATTIMALEFGTTQKYDSIHILSDYPFTGNDTLSVYIYLKDLQPDTEYHYRISAVNEGGLSNGDDVSFKTPTTLSDVEGNIYSTVKIGNLMWTAENLRATKFNNGVNILNITSGSVPDSSLYWNYDDDPSKGEKFGRLYNYKAVTDINSLCPTGWHVPVHDDFVSLNTLYGPLDYNLIETGVDKAANNMSGFTGLFGGYRNAAGIFSGFGSTGYWISSSIYLYDTKLIYGFQLANSSTGLLYPQLEKNGGYSVRCVKGSRPLVKPKKISVTNTSATISGIVNPNGLPTTVTLQYGPTTSYGQSVTIDGNPFSGGLAISFNHFLNGLTPGKTYNYRLKAENPDGINYSSNESFTVANVPLVGTFNPLDVTSGTAVLRGQVESYDNETKVTFEYGLTTAYGMNIDIPESLDRGTKGFEIPVSGLLPNQIYHVRLKGANIYGTGYGSDVSFNTSVVTDFDGNTYHIVKIGNKEWMQENLMVTHYANGDPIEEVRDDIAWANLKRAAYCTVNNDQSLVNTYGMLYNAYATWETRNICPTGWHIPTIEEINSLYQQQVILKEKTYWLGPTSAITNNSGFSGRPAGSRSTKFSKLGAMGIWYGLPSAKDIGYVDCIYLDTLATNSVHATASPYMGFSVRCVRGPVPLVNTLNVTDLTATSATINGAVNGNTLATTVTFNYGSNNSVSYSYAATPSVVNGNTSTDVKSELKNLTPATTYFYRVTAQNASGKVNGMILKFQTLSSK